MIRGPPSSTLFPSPTLFRSRSRPPLYPTYSTTAGRGPSAPRGSVSQAAIRSPPKPEKLTSRTATVRSEEHTSELQSRQYLVCRLLLEKKKKSHNSYTNSK